MRLPRRFATIALCLAAQAVVAQASAQDAGSTAMDEEARGLFAAGKSAFDGGHYQNALDDFQRAYELSHRAELLYNIGLAADRLRLDEDALRAFDTYLRELPDAENRTEVQARVEALHAAIDRDRAAARHHAAAPVVPPPQHRSILEEWWLWTLIGIVVVGVAVGIGVAVASQSQLEPPITGQVGPGGFVIALDGR